MKKKRGIILRSFLPHKQKISVLTEHSGKINLVVRNVKSCLPAGSIITFHANLNTRFVVMSDEKFIHVPLDGDLEHLCWLHRMLEICYYLVPLSMPCQEVFHVVLGAIRISRFADEVMKKICLIKLLGVLGFQPPDELIGLSDLFDSLSTIDSPDCQKVRSLLKETDKWIFYCLKEHPHAVYFKTMWEKKL